MDDAPTPLTVWSCIAAGITAGLLLATTTFGTNDVAAWQRFAEEASNGGVVWIYAADERFNHPPPMTLFLMALGRLTMSHPEWFPFLLRLPSILATGGISLLLYRLLRHFRGEISARWIAGMAALNPVLILIGGFHGNTDSIFLLLILLCLHSLLLRDRSTRAAVFLGLACWVKIVPLLCFPAIFFWLRTARERLRFFSVVSGVIVAGYAYHLMVTPGAMLGNVLGWGGVAGVWGVSKIYERTHSYPELLLFLAKFKMIIPLAISLFVFVRQRTIDSTPRWKSDGRTLLESIGWTFLLTLMLASGFGVQYLAWLVPTTVFLGAGMWSGFTVLASVFLFRVYNYWSRGFPWCYADSEAMGSWGGLASALDWILWCYLVGWAVLRITRELQWLRIEKQVCE